MGLLLYGLVRVIEATLFYLVAYLTADLLNSAIPPIGSETYIAALVIWPFCAPFLSPGLQHIPILGEAFRMFDQIAQSLLPRRQARTSRSASLAEKRRSVNLAAKAQEGTLSKSAEFRPSNSSSGTQGAEKPSTGQRAKEQEDVVQDQRLLCPHCGHEYDPHDYRQGIDIFCEKCRGKLPSIDPT